MQFCSKETHVNGCNSVVNLLPYVDSFGNIIMTQSSALLSTGLRKVAFPVSFAFKGYSSIELTYTRVFTYPLMG